MLTASCGDAEIDSAVAESRLQITCHLEPYSRGVRTCQVGGTSSEETGDWIG